MEQSTIVLADGQTPPSGTIAPPRLPQWQDTFAYISNPDRFCRTNLDRYGPIFQTSVFGGTTVFVGEARGVQMALNGDSEYTEIGLPATTMAMFGEYSLFQRPDLHRQRKSALRPGFTGQMLAGYVPRMQQTIEHHLQTWDLNAPIQLVTAIEAACFDVLAPLLLGVRLDQGDAALKGLPISSINELKGLYKTFFDGFYGLVKWKSPLTAFGRGQQARSRLIELMRSIVQQRRMATIDLDPTTDFLGMMLASQQTEPEGIFSDTLIENQCLLQLWASHYEMMALVSAWIYLIGQHPDLLQRLRSEQESIFGVVSTMGMISSEHLKQMTFLEATIKETLRLLPPTSTANRRLTKSVVLDGVLYKKGWTLIAEPRIAHKLDAHFIEPDKFDPDRFLPPRSEGKMYEFIPFGGGVHACLGAQLAMTMAKVFGSHLLHRFDWQSTTEAPFLQFPLKRIQDKYQTKFYCSSHYET